MQTSEHGANGDMRQTHTHQAIYMAVATSHRLKYTTAEDETYSLQLLIKAFKMWSSELKTSRETGVRECVSA